MSIDSALLCRGDALPTAAAVVAAIKSYGHEMNLPDRFEFAVRDDELWRVSKLDGEETGFDYVITDVSNWGEDANLPQHCGDKLLEFGARGDASIKLVAHIQRAICELAGAYGWIDGQLYEPQEIIDDAKYTIETWDQTSAELSASFDSQDYGPPPVPPNKIAMWWQESGRWNLLGVAAGLAAVGAMIVYKAYVK